MQKINTIVNVCVTKCLYNAPMNYVLGSILWQMTANPLLILMSTWPSIEDDLFVEDITPLSTSVATEPSERMYHLKNGYKMAGDILIGQSLEMNLAFRKKLIFPALFCYRHFIEMSLKSIIEQYGFVAELFPQSRRYHVLRDLWSDLSILCMPHLGMTIKISRKLLP